MNIFSWEHKGGEGPWGKPKATRKPTASAQRRSGGNGGGNQGPNIDDFIRNAGQRMSGGNGGRGRTISLGILALIVIWILGGFYIVAPDENGIVLRFGKYMQTTTSGLNYHLPSPIETVIKPKVTRENILEVGFRSAGQSQGLLGTIRSGGSIDVKQESLMLTGDENIVDLDFTVRWKIADPRDFLFNIADPENTIKNVAESVMREVVGRHPIDDGLTGNKTQLQQEAKALIQSTLDGYGAGVQISGVELQQVNPPQEVIDAFRDVQAARADFEKMQNEATGYANDILPRARGEAAQILQQAEGYLSATVAKAQGEASRFDQQLTAYNRAKTVTEKRMYLETMEQVFKNARKVVIGSEAAKGVLPYLPLNEIQKGK